MKSSNTIVAEFFFKSLNVKNGFVSRVASRQVVDSLCCLPYTACSPCMYKGYGRTSIGIVYLNSTSSSRMGDRDPSAIVVAYYRVGGTIIINVYKFNERLIKYHVHSC